MLCDASVGLRVLALGLNLCPSDATEFCVGALRAAAKGAVQSAFPSSVSAIIIPADRIVTCVAVIRYLTVPPVLWFVMHLVAGFLSLSLHLSTSAV